MRRLLFAKSLKTSKRKVMRKLQRLTFAAILCTFTTAFTIPTILTKTNTFDPIENGIYKIMEVGYLWELLDSNYEPIRERDDTWLDVGLRSKYAMAKNYASISILEEAFDEDIFVRGPHAGDMDFNSTTSFGYYNPRFIEKAHQALDVALQNPMFKKVARPLYEKHLKSMAHTYQDAFAFVQKEDAMRSRLINDYIFAMASPEGVIVGSFQEKFRGYAEALEKEKNADIYEGFTAPSFWIRRHIDGTADDFSNLLNMAIGHMESDTSGKE